MTIKGSTYGTTSKGDRIDLVTVENSAGLSISVISYGATLISVKMPDRSGKIEEITLGKPDLASYEAGHPYFGSTVGRVCNRISGGKFEIDDQMYSLPLTGGPFCLHGGVNAFDKAVWDIFPFREEKKAGVRFFLVSPDGDEGFPGKLEVSASYTLTEDSELFFDYEAVADRSTPVNLTNHVYWNLTGCEGENILDHRLKLNCSRYLPIVPDQIVPTGEIADVAGTPFDFRKEKAVGRDIEEAGGYDHCFVTSCWREDADGVTADEESLPALKNPPFAVLSEPDSGRKLEFHTTLPGVQLYTGNFLEDEPGRSGALVKNSGLCLETQNFPDAVNQPSFPSSILKPEKKYRQQTVIRFSAT